MVLVTLDPYSASFVRQHNKDIAIETPENHKPRFELDSDAYTALYVGLVEAGYKVEQTIYGADYVNLVVREGE